jgi:hypothetical protein
MSTGVRFAQVEPRPLHLRVFLTFGIIAHYCGGARWSIGELFMAIITL